MYQPKAPEVFIGSDGQSHRYDGLLKEYSEHEWGTFHASQDPRFSQLYGYDHAQMIIDLGDDVHPVRHMSYTEASIAVPIVLSREQSGKSLPDEGHILRLTSKVHDLGECKHADFGDSAPGDVAYNFKKPEHETAETVIRGQILETLFGFIPEGDLIEVESVITNTHELSPLFEFIERNGYYRRSMEAGSLAIKLFEQGDDSERAIQLARLGVKVSNNHIEYLDKNRHMAKVVDRYLISTEGLQDRLNTEFKEFLNEETPA